MQKKPKPVLFDDLDLRHQCEQVLSYIIHFKDNSIRKRPTNLKEWPSWCWRDDFRIRYTQLFFTNTRFYSFCEKMVSLAQKKKTQVSNQLNELKFIPFFCDSVSLSCKSFRVPVQLEPLFSLKEKSREVELFHFISIFLSSAGKVRGRAARPSERPAANRLPKELHAALEA